MNKETRIPNDIYDIRLGDYQKYYSIVTANEGASDEFLETKLLKIFCNLEYAQTKDMPVTEFEELTTKMYSIFDAKCPLKRRFCLTGSDGVEVEFGFIPNLDKMTMGEYIDLNNYFEDVDTMHKAMAVLYRPIHQSYRNREKYKISSYEGTEFFSSVMKDMPLGIALGAKVFFYRLGMKLSKAILSYSRQAMEEETLSEEENKALMKSIDGIRNFIRLQEEMLLKSTKLL